MSQVLWCPIGVERIRRARVKNSLVTALLLTIVSLPFIVFLSTFNLYIDPMNMVGARSVVESISTLFTASLLASWTGILLMVRRSRERIRPMDRTRVGPGILVDSPIMMKKFNEGRLCFWRGKDQGVSER